MAKEKSVVGEEVTAALNDYLLKALGELWDVVSNPKHPEHKRRYFESLSLILRHTAPLRKETVPMPDPPVPVANTTNNNDISVQIANLFHGNSLEDQTNKPIEIEHKIKEE